jgi:ligand-binding sensor domain-containing protein
LQSTSTCRLLCLLLVSLHCWQASAQHAAAADPSPINYQFTEFSARNGLPSSEILSLHLDSRQLLWIGHTAGISRFDGYGLSNYLFAHNKRIGRVLCFLEDTTRHILWIGSAAGLFYYANKEVIPVYFSEGNMPVYSLLMEGQGLWVGTGSGPAWLDASAIDKVSQQDTLTISPRILPAWRTLRDDRRVKKMALRKNGRLLIGNAYNAYESDGKGLEKIWGMSHSADMLNGISVTDDDEVLICANFSGVNFRKDGQWKKLPIPFLTGMDFHQEGNNWYYYNAEAIYQVDVRTKAFRQIMNIPYDHREWGSVFTCDKDGNFWIATHEGLLYARPEIFKSHLQEEPEGFNELYSIYQLKDGTIVTGANRGRLFKRINDHFEMAFPNGKTIFSHAELKSICEMPDGDQWFGSGYQGLARLNKNGWQYFFEEGRSGDKTFLHMHRGRNGELWTTGDKNVTRIKKGKNDSLEFTQFTYRQEISDNPLIRSLVESPGGKIYVGSTWGLATIKDNYLDLIPLQKDQSFAITDMQTTRQGKVWIATQGNGLLLCHFLQDSLVIEKQLTTKDGLSSDIFLKILVDKDDILWAVAYNGINRIERSGNDLSIVAKEIDRSLLKGDYQGVDMIQDDKGIIWMATSSGLLSFDPLVYAMTITAPVLNIESILAIQDEQRASLPLQNDTFAPASLSYKQNSLEFLFTAIHYNNPAAVRYEYRLLGQDTAWIRLNHTRQVTLRNIPAGEYTLEVRAAAGSNQWSNTATWAFTVQAPFWRTGWFLVCVVAAIAALVYFLLKQRIKTLRKKEATKRDFERQIARVKMNMLRAQMNPHFIFNSLNSINNFILKNDPLNASGYLTKFSRLMRMILDNSRSEWVTLENELSALDLYIQLESIRFDNVFEYKLILDEEIDPAQVIIPPLIIQPYVENAIWHGLLYREHPGGILLLEIKRVGEQLSIKVEDNGVGRVASAEMRSRSALKKKSHGMKITGERLDIVNMTYDANTHIEVKDLYDEDQQGCGTSVLITLNYIQNKMV